MKALPHAVACHLVEAGDCRVGVGDCVDDAVIESFWSRMQGELLDRKRWRTRVELVNAIFDYLEIFHNRQRRHSALGMLTPVEFEAVY
jgi:putative transposase